jgi:hypothetical protein
VAPRSLVSGCNGPRPKLSEPISCRDGGPPKLQVQDVHICFGGLRALQAVMLMSMGEIVAIIASMVPGRPRSQYCGVYHPSQGRILLDGQDRTFLLPVASPGSVSRTFQNVALFRGIASRQYVVGHTAICCWCYRQGCSGAWHSARKSVTAPRSSAYRLRRSPPPAQRVAAVRPPEASS